MDTTRWTALGTAALLALSITAVAQDAPKPGPQPGPPKPRVETDDGWAERWVNVYMLGKLPEAHAEVITALSDSDAGVSRLAGESLARAESLTAEQMDAVLAALSSAPHVHGAARAAAAHADVSAEAVATALIEMIHGVDRHRHDAAESALDAVGEDVSPVVVGALADVLRSDDKKARMRAAQILGSLGRGAAPATDALCDLAAQGGAGWDVRAAARALGSTGVVNERVLKTLDECSRGEVKWLRDFARDGLARIGPPAADVLLEMSTRGDPKERMRTLSVLGSCCPTEAVVAHARSLIENGDMVEVQLGLALAEGLREHGATLKDALEPHLESTVFQLRVGAAVALLMTDVPHDAAGNVLLEDLGATDEPDCMRIAFFALQGAAAQAPRAGAPLVARLLESDDPQQRAIGLHLASTMDGAFAERLAPRVGRLAQTDDTAEVAKEALKTLRGWGADAKGAERSLEAILSSADEDDGRRVAAARALYGFESLLPESAKSLERAATSDDARLRHAALRALQASPGSVTVLRTATESPDPVAATIAWVGIGVVAPDETEPYAHVAAALAHEDTKVRAVAAAGARIMPHGTRLPQLELVRLTRDPEERVSRAARESVKVLYGVDLD